MPGGGIGTTLRCVTIIRAYALERDAEGVAVLAGEGWHRPVPVQDILEQERTAPAGRIAVQLVARGDEPIQLHMLIATALGVGLSLMLGIALMTLMFLSSRAHDAEAADHSQKDEHDPRP